MIRGSFFSDFFIRGILTPRQMSSAIGTASQIPISPINKGKVNNGINTKIIDLQKDITADSNGFSI